MSGLLATVRAQPTAVETLTRALTGGRVHHAYLFDGPEGVGKERAAFGLAQALVCERRRDGSADACGVCKACTRAVLREGDTRPLHPDIVVLEKGLYEPTAIGRRTPETAELSIDQVRTLVLARAAFPPLEGKAKVFIVRRAEELSTSAANALLKTLEEPGAKTHFILLSSMSDSLLPTIQSRTQRVRFAALPDAVVTELLVERGMENERAEEIARLSGGSMALASTLGDPDASARRDEFVSRALASLEARDLSGVYDLAEDAKKGDKATLVAQLGALAGALVAEARSTAGQKDRKAEQAAQRHALTLLAVEQLDGNASAQLTVESMLIKMRGA